MSNRTNTQMMISFAQNEAHLADQLAQIAKKNITQSLVGSKNRSDKNTKT